MSRIQQEVKVDGLKFLVTQMPGMAAYRLSIRIMDKLSAAFQPIAAMFKSGTDVMSQDVEVLAPALQSIVGKLSPDELEEVTRQMFDSVEVVENGKKEMVMSVFDTLFQGRTFTAYKLLFHAIRINFLPFGYGTAASGTGPKATLSPSETSNTFAGQQSA